jgi:hypothetical protein
VISNAESISLHGSFSYSFSPSASGSARAAYESIPLAHSALLIMALAHTPSPTLPARFQRSTSRARPADKRRTCQSDVAGRAGFVSRARPISIIFARRRENG